MARNFTDDDRDKDVVTANGNRIGSIRNVDDDRATVDRDDDGGLTDKIKDMLGWGDDDSNEVRNEHVDSINDDEVRLRSSK
ncbi:hypothetical protein [Haloarcula nitratireducens]|uniref:PRC-barrel domain-containing protein n=1 Tax=Haloarcula nitratireducens TaxID=2487749 RepID=A0AAW4PCD4_9EURY|nr:hypothetical protein [Halomicroarcula nitratireducens]MBX0295330.1 hypothetical protein [Halomicroarcula nitratireducens]